MKNGTAKEILINDILATFPPDQGELHQYYGRIGTGKTYAATADALDDLNRGQVVYTNWKIKWNGRDERTEFFPRLLGALGLKYHFRVFPKENLRFIEINENFLDTFARLTSCIVYLDEGHIVYDSYMATRMEMKDRVAILDTRHYDRTVKIISQRPTAIHVVLRANVNRFFKLEVSWQFWKWIIFKKTEFQDTVGDIPDETKDIETVYDAKTGETTEVDHGYKFAISEKTYFGSEKIFAAFDSKYRRGSVPESQLNAGKIYTLTWKESLDNLLASVSNLPARLYSLLSRRKDEIP